jgi:hypothetical protein
VTVNETETGIPRVNFPVPAVCQVDLFGCLVIVAAEKVHVDGLGVVLPRLPAMKMAGADLDLPSDAKIGCQLLKGSGNLGLALSEPGSYEVGPRCPSG